MNSSLLDILRCALRYVQIIRIPCIFIIKHLDGEQPTSDNAFHRSVIVVYLSQYLCPITSASVVTIIILLLCTVRRPTTIKQYAWFIWLKSHQQMHFYMPRTGMRHAAIIMYLHIYILIPRPITDLLAGWCTNCIVPKVHAYCIHRYIFTSVNRSLSAYIAVANASRAHTSSLSHRGIEKSLELCMIAVHRYP